MGRRRRRNKGQQSSARSWRNPSPLVHPPGAGEQGLLVIEEWDEDEQGLPREQPVEELPQQQPAAEGPAGLQEDESSEESESEDDRPRRPLYDRAFPLPGGYEVFQRRDVHAAFHSHQIHERPVEDKRSCLQKLFDCLAPFVAYLWFMFDYNIKAASLTFIQLILGMFLYCIKRVEIVSRIGMIFMFISGLLSVSIFIRCLYQLYHYSTVRRARSLRYYWNL